MLSAPELQKLLALLERDSGNSFRENKTMLYLHFDMCIVFIMNPTNVSGLICAVLFLSYHVLEVNYPLLARVRARVLTVLPATQTLIFLLMNDASPSHNYSHI